LSLFNNKFLSISLGDFELDIIRKKPSNMVATVASDEVSISILTGSNGKSFDLSGELLKSFSKSLADAVSNDLSISLHDVKIVTNQNLDVFTGDFDTAIDLSAAPVIKDFIPSGDKFAVEKTELLYCLKTCSSNDIAAINSYLPVGVSKLPNTIKKGFLGNIVFDFGDYTYVLGSDGKVQRLVMGEAFTPEALKNAPPATGPFNQKLGPIGVQGIGIHLNNGKLTISINGSLNLGPITLTLKDFSVSNPFDLADMHLAGLSLAVNNPPLSLDGLFLNTPIEKDSYLASEYEGKISAVYGNFGVLLEGDLAKTKSGMHAMFLYGVLDMPMAGPPFLSIKSLSGGFAYNRAMELPSPNNVKSFPLIAPMLNTPPVNSPNIESQFPVKAGAYWGVAGLQTDSFKMVDTILLLAFRMDNELEIDIISYSDMKFPRPKEPGQKTKVLADLKVGCVARYIPERGVLSVTGAFLPGSYVFEPEVHISGGFALLTIFKDQTSGQWNTALEGDFIFTIGGYAPHYTVKPYYPRVPRLEMNWQFSPALYIKSQAYFAITPNSMMAGGHLDANFKEGGDLSIDVHFTVGADFIIYWKPYRYSAEIYAALHVSASLTIDCWLFTIHVSVSLDLGANLKIWGPSFSGYASVHVHFLISFSVAVNFGSTAENVAIPLAWAEFSESLLPASAKIISGQVIQGVIASLSNKTLKVVNKKELVLVFKTAIPLRAVTFKSDNTDVGVAAGCTEFGIKPMAKSKKDFNDSTLSVSITKSAGSDVITLSADEIKNSFTIIGVYQNLPSSLWKPADNNEFPRSIPDNEGEHLITNLLTGIEIKPNLPKPSGDKVEVSADPVDDISAGDSKWGSPFDYAAFAKAS